jgi:hypothetical protein
LWQRAGNRRPVATTTRSAGGRAAGRDQEREAEGAGEADGALPAKPVLVRTVTSAEVGELIAKPAGIDAAARGQAEREALKDWIRDAAGQLARGLQAAGR